MPKTFIIGDIHNKWNTVHSVINNSIKEDGHPDRVIFVGDIVNDWNSTPEEEVESTRSWAEWVQKKRDDGIEVITLMGNHDFSYVVGREHPHIGDIVRQSPGFNLKSFDRVHKIFKDINMEIAYLLHNRRTNRETIVSHAGFNEGWVSTYLGVDPDLTPPAEIVARANAVGERLNKDDYSWSALYKCGRERGGRDRFSSPLWCGMNELSSSHIKGVDQIVGHTPVEGLTCSPDGEVVFCDTFSTFTNGMNIGDNSIIVTEDFD